ncbi:MAG TPA: IPT/TIG domain-containing protein, partial [Candidatus Sulfopaludibacter sp.]|nr:IPT/TIG domain-containing protein [Candidatus Sulfopaludibacter sp.]
SASLTPSSLTATQIAVTVSANLIAQAGSLPVTVTTPGGAKSNSETLTITSSPITITSISPNSVVAGSAAFNMTVTGSGFVQGSSVTVGSASLTPSSLTATQIVVTVPANLIAQAGSLPVTVTTADGRTSNSVTLAVTNPAVTITAISPTSVAAGGAAFTLTVTGSGFLQGATVTVGNATLTPASLTATQITVSVPANLIAQAGSLGVTVTTPDGRTSNSVPLTLAAPFMLTSLSPATVIATGPAFTLTIAGVGFASGATVQVGSATLQPATVTSTQITVSVPAASIAQTGTLQVTVTNPNNVISNALPLTAGAVPAITSVSPSSVLPGAAAFTLTVTGTGFTSGSVVQWNGQALATAVAGATQLTTQVPASLVAAAGSATVAVITSGVSSNTVQFKIALPPLTNVSVSAPSSAPSGQDQSLTVNLGASYPVDLQGKLTLTFAGDGGLPDDPAIQFQNQSRVFTFTVPAGTTPQPVQVTVKTGTVSGVITITPAFTASGTDVTPSGIAPQHIQIARAAPQITSVTCSRSGSSFTTVIDGFTNTREATQGTFDFQAATGASLGTTELIVPATSLFSGWFGSSAAATAGGLFRYTQPFNVQGSATAVAAVSVKLTNATGTSAAVSCQLQ